MSHFVASLPPGLQHDENAEPYWRDVGTLEAYLRANLDLASVMPELDMYDRAADWDLMSRISIIDENNGRRVRIAWDALVNFGDHHQLLADYLSSIDTQDKTDKLWQHRDALNIVNMGYFSSDRTIQEYADVSPVSL